MKSVFAALSSSNDGRTIVARTPLMASVIGHQLAQARMAEGRESWERQPVYSIDAWLSSCRQEARFSAEPVPALLSGLQETLLWQSIIEEHTPGLFDASTTARLARRAAAIVAEWKLPLDHDAWNDHEDGRQFLSWFNRFRTICYERGWTTRADLWRELPEWLDRGIVTPTAVAFAGFTELSPALKEVQQHLPHPTVMGTAETYTPRRAPVLACPDFETEIDTAARWARARFEENPGKSIGIFVPDLPSHRSLIERTFNRVFYPASALRLSEPPAECIFHLHAAAALRDHPIVNGALLLLELAEYRIDQAVASTIIRSPFLRGAATERDQRSLADLKLRRARSLDVNLRDVKYAAAQCPILLQTLNKIDTLVRAKPANQSLAEWSKFFSDVLEAAGWPGDAELSPEEQETLELWKDSLSTLATLGAVSKPVSFEQAHSQLRKLLAGSAAISRGDLFSPVQILDAKDAYGLQFDSAFIAGLSDTTWPPASDVSPLVPLRLQRECGVPGSSQPSLQKERERLTRALFTVAPTVQASYSEQLAPIAQKYVASNRARPLLWKGRLPLQSFEFAATKSIEDTNAPRFVVNGAVPGGTSIIKSQSCCPFKAFAEIRLQARTQEDGSFGFDARERGGFLHQALELVWRDLKTQARLKATPEAELRQLVASAVSEAVNVQRENESFAQVVATERTRLEELIYEWLRTVEAARAVPFTVEEVERELSFNLAGLPLKLRIDRIDRLRNGKLVLIDYKSGKQTKKKFDCPRPSEPQLLVYAAAKGNEVEGVFFGQLRPRELKFIGMARDMHSNRHHQLVLSNKWDETMETARIEMLNIALNFLDGKAAVDPKGSVCSFCTTKPFCRISEHLTAEEDDE
jgi:probable DNA repair protein